MLTSDGHIYDRPASKTLGSLQLVRYLLILLVITCTRTPHALCKSLADKESGTVTKLASHLQAL